VYLPITRFTVGRYTNLLYYVHIWEKGGAKEALFPPEDPFHCWARKRALAPPPVSLLG